MLDTLLREINGWVYGWFGAEGLGFFQEHPLAYTLGGALIVLALHGLIAYAGWSAARRIAETVGRTGRLLLSRAGRRTLALAAEIRRGRRRLGRAAERAMTDRAERRAMLGMLERFVREDLEAALEQMHAWIAISGEIRVRDLQRGVEQGTRRWSALAEGTDRRALEETLAGKKQQLALAQRAQVDRERLLDSLEEAAAAIRPLEAELVALGEARSQSLPGFRAHLAELSEGFRRQRDVHLEYRAGPG